MQSDVPFDGDQIDPENKSRKFYESCIDKDEKIESLGSPFKPMLDLIRSLGGWPVIPRLDTGIKKCFSPWKNFRG